MIKALIYTDLQATEGAERLFNDPSVPLQRYRVTLFYRKLFEVYQQYQCNALWDLGDTTDDRIAIPIPTLKYVMEGLKPFAGLPYNVKLSGNHEQYTRNADIDSGCLFEGIFNVAYNIQAFEFEGVVIIGVKFPSYLTTSLEELDSMMLKYRHKPIIVLGHLEISGSRMNSGVAIGGFPPEAFSMASLTLLGHVHIPQQIGDKPIYYVGSPFQQNFGESGEDKRLGLVTIDGDNISLEWIPLEGFPKYQYVSLSEFKANFSPTSEDRYSVKITSPEEAEEFFKHPYSGRARVEYNYQVMTPTLPSNAKPTDWNLHAAARRWVEVCDPALQNISLPPEELLEFGLQIAEGSTVK
jgi:hypothetical protein